VIYVVIERFLLHRVNRTDLMIDDTRCRFARALRGDRIMLFGKDAGL
jgi:hypothetical protein